MEVAAEGVGVLGAEAGLDAAQGEVLPFVGVFPLAMVLD